MALTKAGYFVLALNPERNSVVILSGQMHQVEEDLVEGPVKVMEGLVKLELDLHQMLIWIILLLKEELHPLVVFAMHQVTQRELVQTLDNNV